MRILVNFPDPAERDALCNMLRLWMELTCVSADLVTAEPEEADGPGVCPVAFWDLDGPELPPPTWCPPDRALFLCSRDPRRAIASYSFHPTGFLLKPVSMEHLQKAMRQCSCLWFSALMRLEIYDGRVKIGIPFSNLLCVEGARQGCRIHTTHQRITSQEPLYRLEQQLPEKIFIRCQHSFVVNFTYVQQVAGDFLQLYNGAEIPIGRRNRGAVLEAYRRFCQLRYGAEKRIGRGEEKGRKQLCQKYP